LGISILTPGNSLDFHFAARHYEDSHLTARRPLDGKR